MIRVRAAMMVKTTNGWVETLDLSDLDFRCLEDLSCLMGARMDDCLRLYQ